MKLSVLERIVLQNILPTETNYLNYKVLTTLRSELSFSEKEIKDWKIEEREVVPGTKTVVWDDKFEKLKEVSIGEKATEIISDALKQLDKEKKINSQNASLYERFVLGK